MLKLLYLDTCTIVKFFIKNESGHELVKWIVDNGESFCFTLHTSQITPIEFEKVINRKFTDKVIDEKKRLFILRVSKMYFEQVFHISDAKRIPKFKVGNDLTFLELCQKHKLSIKKNSFDARHLACVINYLRCFGLGSKVQVITSDRKFSKVIESEGYTIIDPEKVSVLEFQKILSELDKT